VFKIIKSKSLLDPFLGVHIFNWYNSEYGWYITEFYFFKYFLKFEKHTKKEIKCRMDSYGISMKHIYNIKNFFHSVYIDNITKLKIAFLNIKGFKVGKRVKVKNDKFQGIIIEISYFNTKLKYNNIYLKVLDEKGFERFYQYIDLKII
jgi:hypothetical protein